MSERADPGTDELAIPIIDEALDLPEPEREAFVRRRCADSPRLCEWVLSAITNAGEDGWPDALAGSLVPASDDPGSELARYRLIEMIGYGSMGVVHRARDTKLDREVAVKFVVPAGPIGDEDDHPALREARASGDLDHPAIVPVYDVGVSPGRCWFVTAYVPGQTLRDLLAAGADDDAFRLSPLWAATASLIVSRCAAGLAHAHERGVIHRDVKPSNILIDAEGRPRLIDFGVALLTGDAHLGAETTGTLEYLSPERVAPSPAPPSPADDVYALAVTLYECLAAKRPHTARTTRGARTALAAAPTPVRVLNPAVSPALGRVLARALAPDRAERYDTAAAFGDDLRRAARGEPLERDGLARRLRYALTRRRATAVGLAVALAGITALALVMRPPVTTGVLEIDAPPGAAVTVSPIGGPAAGPLEAVHTGAGSARLTLKNGVYRVQIEDNRGVHELTRRVDAGGRAGVTLPPPRPGDLPSDMVLIPAGPAVVGIANAPKPELARRTVDLPAFWIDRREVTNAEYLRYVQATGAPAPASWASGAPVADDARPVTGVTLAQARGYAEWAGKRLPTHVEWERAAAGAEGRRYPWGEDSPPPAVEAGGLTGLALYLAVVEPVNDPTADVSAEGVERMYGNVSEWTESLTSLRMDGDDAPVCIVKGADSAHSTAPANGVPAVILHTPERVNLLVGFRCARSAR